MIKRFVYSPKFDRKLKGLSKNLRLEVIEELHSFARDSSQSHHRIHTLHNALSGWLSLTILPDLLIIFKFTDKKNTEVLLYDMGTHEIYQEYL